MAVDIYFFSSLEVEEVQAKIDLLRTQHQGLFFNRFIIYDADRVNDTEKEIALENKMMAKSQFMISLNDKSAADLVSTVLLLVRLALGPANVIAVSNGVLRK
ncbi:hypothetical protein ABE501_20165 [Comamonas testosteroni]